MAEVGGKPREHGLDVEPGAIPAQQGTDGEAVAEIVTVEAGNGASEDGGRLFQLPGGRSDRRWAAGAGFLGWTRKDWLSLPAVSTSDRVPGRTPAVPRACWESTGMCLDLPNLLRRMVRTPSSQSTSVRSRRMASPRRMPVTASRPMRVW